jgi:hypothetical protein
VQIELLEQRDVIITYRAQYSCAKWDRYKYDFRALFTASWDIYLVAGSAVTPDPVQLHWGNGYRDRDMKEWKN